MLDGGPLLLIIYHTQSFALQTLRKVSKHHVKKHNDTGDAYLSEAWEHAALHGKVVEGAASKTPKTPRERAEGLPNPQPCHRRAQHTRGEARTSGSTGRGGVSLPGDVIDEQRPCRAPVVASRHRPGRVTGFHFPPRGARTPEHHLPTQNTHFCLGNHNTGTEVALKRNDSKLSEHGHEGLSCLKSCHRSDGEVGTRGWDECGPPWRA